MKLTIITTSCTFILPSALISPGSDASTFKVIGIVPSPPFDAILINDEYKSGLISYELTVTSTADDSPSKLAEVGFNSIHEGPLI